jgi:hypothetical protein
MKIAKTNRSEPAMLRKLPALLILVCAIDAAPAFGQKSVTFQNGVTMLSGGGLYEATSDNEFRAAAPTTSQGENEGVTVDEFDGGFQTQGAIRFENLLISQGGLVPDDLAREDILFAELRLWGTSSSDADANITFHRVLGEDWDEDDTWASLGGDLIPDEFGLLDGDPILADDVEAAAAPDFQVENTEVDSADLLSSGLAAGLPLLDAIDTAFFRFDATDAVRDWLIDGQQNRGWAINNDTGNGWDFTSSELMTVLQSEWTDAGLLPENFHPALTVVFVDGPILDLDADDDVDELDFAAFLDLLAVELDGPIQTGAPGDFDFDRDVDLNDFKFFKNNYADQHAMFPPGGGGSLAGGAVPEPTSGVLAALALLGAAAARRRVSV